MIDAPAGTGKTYTERVIAARLRGEGYTVLIVASTGIAALQLPGGWTAHSMFKLPLNERVVDGAICGINNQSQRAELIRKSDLIIFGELPMTHRFCIEALERTLRDIRHSEALYAYAFQATGVSVAPSYHSAQLQTQSKHPSFLAISGQKPHACVSERDRQPTTTLPDGTKLVPLSNEWDSSTNDHFCLQYTTDFNDLVNFVLS